MEKLVKCLENAWRESAARTLCKGAEGCPETHKPTVEKVASCCWV